MFCPVGYVSWAEMSEMAYEWAQRIMLARKYEEDGKDPSLAFDDEINVSSLLMLDYLERVDLPIDQRTDLFMELEVHRAILHAWVLTKVIQEFETLVCSHDGSLMRAPSLLGTHIDELQWCYPWLSDGAKSGWSLRKTTEFFRYFEIFDKDKYSFPNIVERLCFVDGETGVVTVKNGSLRYLMNWGRINKISAEILIEKAIKPYVGWSLVWNPDEFPETLWDVLEMLGVEQTDWQGSSEKHTDTSKKGRKGLVQARGEFSKLSPQELSLPLKEIAILLRDRTGEHPAESTIRLWKG